VICKTKKAIDAEALNLDSHLTRSKTMPSLEFVQMFFANYALGSSGACAGEY